MVIIVGSGAGGAILAMELAKANVDVVIIEKGKYIDSKDAFNYYDKYNDDVDLLATTCVGGSTMVSMANMVRALDEELYDYGINLSKEYDYVEDLIKVHELDDSHIGKGTQLFLDAAKDLGLNSVKMPKAIYEEKCIQCGQCAFGCPVDAKWTAKHFVDIAIENGAKFIEEAEISELIIEDNQIKGVKFIKGGHEETLTSDTVVLAAGAIGSALILRKIGIDAGRELFFDPFVSVGGVIKDINFDSEVQMAGLVAGKNFVLSPHYSSFIPSKIGGGVEAKDILSIMVKTPDEGRGYITDGGDVVKINTINDIRYLAEGTTTAGFILEKAGVDPSTIASTVYRGAHPGGSAAIGKFVDSNLETEIKGLFVDDASVLPVSPGKPPILTILALSKRLADYLIS
jgi:choline dehydrogenase-like flavoprotein